MPLDPSASNEYVIQLDAPSELGYTHLIPASILVEYPRSTGELANRKISAWFAPAFVGPNDLYEHHGLVGTNIVVDGADFDVLYAELTDQPWCESRKSLCDYVVQYDLVLPGVVKTVVRKSEIEGF